MVQERKVSIKGAQNYDIEGKASSTYFGPVHWLAVAQIMDTSLLVSTWVSTNIQHYQ